TSIDSASALTMFACGNFASVARSASMASLGAPENGSGPGPLVSKELTQLDGVLHSNAARRSTAGGLAAGAVAGAAWAAKPAISSAQAPAAAAPAGERRAVCPLLVMAITASPGAQSPKPKNVAASSTLLR